jgi:8-oxo-dGTP pyrophosphatase MutT (NUDIX family)
VIGVIGQQDKLLIIRRSRWVRAPGAYCFPGGHIEPGETEQAALVREFREELHVEVRPVRRLWQNATSWQVDLAWWLASAPPDAVYVPHLPEVESFHWLTPDEAAVLPGLLESNRLFLDAVRRGELSLAE